MIALPTCRLAGRFIPLLAAGAAAATLAAPLQAEPLELRQRREQLRDLNRHQEEMQQQRLRCINQAPNLRELEACDRGYRGGWHCPMWW